MKHKSKASFTALLAVLGVLAIAIGIVMYFHNAAPVHHTVGYLLTGLTMLAGTTIIQTFPIAGTFPTSAQAVGCNTQINRVVMADGDTSATLTHNWGLTAAQLAQFLPLISFYVQNPGVSYPVVSFALTDSNTVTMAKTGTTGSGGTYVVALQRPYSATL